MSLFVRTGFYRGNGTSRVIDELGFTPKFIRIFARFPGTTAGALNERWKFDTLAGNVAWGGDAANDDADCITIDSGGFTVGLDADVNTSGAWYSWQAFGGTDVVTDTYTGDGNSTQAITGVGSKPKFVQICRTDVRRTFRFDSQTGDSSFDSQYSASGSNYIESIDSDGFTVGDSSYVNADTFTYHYVCFVGSDVVAGTYTGSGSSRSIDTGINAEALYIKRDEAAYEAISPGWEIPFDQTVNQYLETLFENTLDPVAWQINYWRLDNDYIRVRKGTSFQIEGGNAESNANGGTYFYLAVSNTTRETDQVRLTALETQVLWLPDTPDDRLTALDIQVLFAPEFGPGAFGDDLDNWNDSISLAIEYIPQAFGDDLDNWNDSAVNDYPGMYESVGDDLNNWTDSGISFEFDYLLEVISNLNNWTDDEAYDLAAAGPDKTIQEGSDLDSWLDAVALQLNHFLEVSDDLDNWLDDEAHSLVDAALTESVASDLDNWLDAVQHDFIYITKQFGDSLNNWGDRVQHDHPDILLKFGDSLNNWLDSIGKFGQPYPEDSLNYWQDNISIMMANNLRYQVFVDWEDDGVFGSEIDNITNDVKEMQWSYGRDYASQLTGNSTAGSCSIVLRNNDGKYNSFKSSSPLYGYLVPGRKINIIMYTSDTATQMFGGTIDSIEPRPSIHRTHTAVLKGLGPITAINEQKVNVEMHTNIKTGAAVNRVLDAAGWSPSDRLMDEGYVTMGRWWTGGKILALTAIRRIEDTEAGFFRETKDGKLAFEDKWHRLKLANFVSKATFRDVHSASVVYADIYQQDPLKEIYNIAKTKVRYFEVRDEAVLWVLQEEPLLGSRETVEYWASCPSASSSSGALAAEEWIAPVRGTDVTAGITPGGTGYAAYINTVITKFDTGMKILLTNRHPTTPLYLSKLQARGTGLYETPSTNIQDEYEDSQALYGERTWPATDTFFPNIAEAEGYIHWILENYSFPRPIINLEFSTYRNDELAEKARTLDISDLIDIESNATTKLGVNRKFFIEKITHRVTDGGLEHRVQFECSAAVGGVFVEQAVGDDLNNWDDGINFDLQDVIYTPIDKTLVIHEMFGQGHSSRSSSDGGDYLTNFATLTLDPSKFNGVVKVEWEIVGDNYDSTSKDIELYEEGISIKTLAIGASQYFYRTSIEFTWPSSTKRYTINIPQTTTTEDVVVYRSRLKIYLEDSTHAQIQIMFHGDALYGWNYWGSPCAFQGGDSYPAAAWDTNDTSWVYGDAVSELFKDAHCRWTYNASHWGTLNGMILEAAMGVDPNGSSCSGYIQLYNEDTAQAVGPFLTLVNDASPNCPITDEKTTTIDPALLNDGDTYVLQGKVVGSGVYVSTYRACIYLELREGLEAFETYYDMGREGTLSDWEQLKHYFDFDDFGHITNVRSWVEAAITASGGDGRGVQITDGVDDYGFIGFPWTDTSYEIREQIFNYRSMSAGNHYTDSTGFLRLRANRVVVYQNVNEMEFVDDLNNWNDDANVVKNP